MNLGKTYFEKIISLGILFGIASNTCSISYWLVTGDYPPMFGIFIISVFILFLFLLGISFFSNKRWFVLFVSTFDKNLIPVEMVDCDFVKNYSIAKKGNDGQLHAQPYWLENVGDCILLSDGWVDIKSESNYYLFWLPLKREQRAEMLLTHEFPDFNEEPSYGRNNKIYQMRLQRFGRC
jgi:hypothetical protein